MSRPAKHAGRRAMTAQSDNIEKVDMAAVREMFRAARQFVDAVTRLEDSLDESIGFGRVLSVCRIDCECGINTPEIDDLALCLRLGNCCEDSWGDN